MTSTYYRPKRARSRPSSRRPFRPRELRDSGILPAKALGQHFLTDRNVIAKIVAACDLSRVDTVIEVGPGLGVLTERLVEAAGKVIAVEIDPRLCQRLRERFVSAPNLTVVESDVLTVSPDELLLQAGLPPSQAYGVAGSLPYNIGAAVLRHFLEAEQPPRWLVVLLQREVAASITAAPGDLSLLGVSVQVYAEPRRLFNVSPRAFYPPPKVMSAALRFDLRAEPLVPRGERDRFFAVVRAGFSAPRKQLRNSLAQGLRRPPGELTTAIEAAGLDPTLRPEDLSIDHWLRLARHLGA